MKTSGLLRIGELATQLILNLKTIRYYEEIGLLPQPQRTDSGDRQYGDTDVERLCFIGKAKAIGLTLDEIREILALRADGEQPCERVVDLIEEKLDHVDRQLRALTEFRQELLMLRDEATQSTNVDSPVCRIIEQHAMRHAAEPTLVGLGRSSTRPSSPR